MIIFKYYIILANDSSYTQEYFLLKLHLVSDTFGLVHLLILLSNFTSMYSL